MKVDLSEMAQKWPSAIVSRDEVGTFTGGAMRSKTLANLDSKGEGPEGAFRVGRKIVYPVKNFVAWFERRAELKA